MIGARTFVALALKLALDGDGAPACDAPLARPGSAPAHPGANGDVRLKLPAEGPADGVSEVLRGGGCGGPKAPCQGDGEAGAPSLDTYGDNSPTLESIATTDALRLVDLPK